jgi:hypothetical protein
MPKVALIQQNFNGGEYSQGIRKRDDLAFYYNGAERMANFFPTKEGNLKFRTGLYYGRGAKSDNKTYLIPFISSSDDRFLLEFSNLVLRVYKDGAQVGGDIVSPYRLQDLFNIEYAQEKSIMLLVDDVHPPYRLTGTTTFTLALENFDYSTDNKVPPLLAENLTATTITPSAVTGTVTLTASAALFNALDIGRYIKIRDAGTGNFGFARITAYTSTTVVTALVVKDFHSTAAKDTWSFSMLPAAVTFYEQRLVYGQFNRIVFSRSPDDNGIVRYNDFTLGTDVDHGMQYESGLLRGNIQWMTATDRMIAIGTYTGVFKADSGNVNEPITPENPPTIKKISAEGTTNIMPVQKENIVFFVSRDKKRVLSLKYNFDNDGYLIEDKMLLSDEIAQEGITQLAYKLGDENILYATKDNGELIGMIHNPDQQINGWFRIETDGLVESVSSVPKSTGEDRVFVSVSRTINSSTKRYIEYFADEVVLPKRTDYFTGVKATDRENYLFAMWEAQKDFIYLDSSLIYDGSDQSVTMTPSATTGLDITFTAGGALFVAGDVDRQIWEKEGTGRAVIISYTSNTVVKCNIISNFASTSAIAAGDWYFTSDNYTGLSHLEGESVNIIRDGGRDESSYTVASGEITISQQASKVTVGMPYVGLFKSMSIEGGSANGTSQSKAKLVNNMAIYFLNSIDCFIGTDLYNLNRILFGVGEITGRPITAFTGYKKLDLPERYEEEKHIYIVQTSPLPCIAQSILPLLEGNNER